MAKLTHLWNSEARGGIILFAAALVAFLIANTGGYDWYKDLKHTEVSFAFGENFSLRKTLSSWIKDGLMCLFFLLVGLEIKREIVAGQLANPRRAILTIMAAIGGMIAPAILYTIFNLGKPEVAGWGIPMATDIAFSLGVLSLLGKKVPIGLKVFLTAFAIVDDLGAVLVIAFFYTSSLNFQALFISLGFFLLALAFGFAQVRSLLAYGIVGLFMWYFMLQSGVSPTVAAVLLAFAIPMSKPLTTSEVQEKAASLSQKLGDGEFGEHGEPSAALEHTLHQSESPLHRLEHILQPWCTYLILPLFAFFNAGVNLSGAGFSSVSVGTFLGLLLGKPIGIFLICWIAVRLRIAVLPAGVSWGMILGAGFLGGIGFTMSLFVAALAFPNAEASLNQATIGVLSASVVAAVVGVWLVSRAAQLKP